MCSHQSGKPYYANQGYIGTCRNIRYLVKRSKLRKTQKKIRKNNQVQGRGPCSVVRNIIVGIYHPSENDGYTICVKCNSVIIIDYNNCSENKLWKTNDEIRIGPLTASRWGWFLGSPWQHVGFLFFYAVLLIFMNARVNNGMTIKHTVRALYNDDNIILFSRPNCTIYNIRTTNNVRATR